jgi:hypothetical protein
MNLYGAKIMKEAVFGKVSEKINSSRYGSQCCQFLKWALHKRSVTYLVELLQKKGHYFTAILVRSWGQVFVQETGSNIFPETPVGLTT